jgi:hypothetical protein
LTRPAPERLFFTFGGFGGRLAMISAGALGQRSKTCFSWFICVMETPQYSQGIRFESPVFMFVSVISKDHGAFGKGIYSAFVERNMRSPLG